MIARKQKISRQLNELIDAPPAGESCPSRPSANIAGSPPLKSFLVFRVLIARGSLSSPMGPFLVPRWAPWPPPIKQEPEALNGDRRDIFPAISSTGATHASRGWRSPTAPALHGLLRRSFWRSKFPGRFISFRRAWVPDANLLVVYYQR